MYILSMETEDGETVNVCAFVRFPSKGLMTMKTYMGYKLSENEAEELLLTGSATTEDVTFLLHSIMVIDEDI